MKTTTFKQWTWVSLFLYVLEIAAPGWVLADRLPEGSGYSLALPASTVVSDRRPTPQKLPPRDFTDGAHAVQGTGNLYRPASASPSHTVASPTSDSSRKPNAIVKIITPAPSDEHSLRPQHILVRPGETVRRPLGNHEVEISNIDNILKIMLGLKTLFEMPCESNCSASVTGEYISACDGVYQYVINQEGQILSQQSVSEKKAVSSVKSKSPCKKNKKKVSSSKSNPSSLNNNQVQTSSQGSVNQGQMTFIHQTNNTCINNSGGFSFLEMIGFMALIALISQNDQPDNGNWNHDYPPFQDNLGQRPAGLPAPQHTEGLSFQDQLLNHVDTTDMFHQENRSLVRDVERDVRASLRRVSDTHGLSFSRALAKGIHRPNALSQSIRRNVLDGATGTVNRLQHSLTQGSTVNAIRETAASSLRRNTADRPERPISKPMSLSTGPRDASLTRSFSQRTPTDHTPSRTQVEVQRNR